MRLDWLRNFIVPPNDDQPNCHERSEITFEGGHDVEVIPTVGLCNSLKRTISNRRAANRAHSAIGTAVAVPIRGPCSKTCRRPSLCKASSRPGRLVRSLQPSKSVIALSRFSIQLAAPSF